jgi:hypothetical protein
MVDICWDYHSPARYLVAHQFRSELFLSGDVLHLIRDHTVSGVVHLREVAVRILGLTAGNPLGARTIHATVPVCVMAVAVMSICRWHGFQSSSEIKTTL